MTIGTDVAQSGPYFPNGVVTSFPFGISISDPSDISVVWIASDGTESVISPASYTVTISASEAGGTVVFSTAPSLPSAGSALWIVLDPEFVQQDRYSDEGPFNQSLLEGSLDRLARLSIWLRSRADRALRAPFGDDLPALPTAAARANRFLAFDASGNPIPSSGTGADAGLRADLAAATGGTSLVNHVAAGAGARGRALVARLREEAIRITDYGAIGDGTLRTVQQWIIPGSLGVYASLAALQVDFPHVTATTDSIDWAATQAAANYASTLGEGARIHAPRGAYVYNKPVTIRKSGVVFYGDGGPATWLINATIAQPVLDFGDGVSTYFRNGIYDLIFGQASGVVPMVGNCGLRARKCGQIELDGVKTFQFPSQLFDGIVFDNVTQCFMNAIAVQGCANRGIFMSNQTFDVYMNNGRTDACAVGIEWRDCQGIQGSNWTSYGNATNAYLFSTSGSVDNNQFFFLTNFIGDTSGQHNWNIQQLSLSTLTNCWAATQLVPVTGPAFDGFFLNGGDVEDIFFNSCIAVSNNRHGMNIQFANRITINGGKYGSNFKPSAFGGLGARNGLSGAGSGIKIQTGSTRIAIRGAYCENNRNWGIDVDAGATSVEISDCETRFNIDGSIRNNANATASECRIRNCAGFNPLGFIAAPSVPASNTPITNLTGVDVMVYLVGGTLTGNVQIGGHGVMAFTDRGYYLPAGSTIRLTYSAAPAWSWNGL